MAKALGQQITQEWINDQLRIATQNMMAVTIIHLAFSEMNVDNSCITGEDIVEYLGEGGGSTPDDVAESVKKLLKVK